MIEIKIGMRLICYKGTQLEFSGVVTCVHNYATLLCMDRDDKKKGGGCGGSWLVSITEDSEHMISLCIEELEDKIRYSKESLDDCIIDLMMTKEIRV